MEERPPKKRPVRQKTEPRLSMEQKQEMEDESFKNMCHYFEDILLKVHETGKRPKPTKNLNSYYISKRLLAYGLILKRREKVGESTTVTYRLTEKTLKVLGIE